MSNRTILVVDDEELARRNVTDWLSGKAWAACDIVTAVDGQDGLTKLASHRPDLVVLDLRMPQAGGLELLERVRQDPASKGVRIVVYTNYDDRDSELRALELGADDFVGKRRGMRVLEQRIRACLDRAAPRLRPADLPHPRRLGEAAAPVLRRGGAAAVLDCNDLRHFGHVRGYAEASRLVEQLATLLGRQVEETPGANHDYLGADDFCLRCSPDRVASLAAGICDAFDNELRPEFYAKSDAGRGYTEGPAASGEPHRHPLLTLSVAVFLLPPKTTYEALLGDLRVFRRLLKHRTKQLARQAVTSKPLSPPRSRYAIVQHPLVKTDLEEKLATFGPASSSS